MKLLKTVIFSSLLVSSYAAATDIEVIQVKDPAGSVQQGFDLTIVVQQLQAEIRALRGLVESQQHQLTKLQQQQQDMYSDLDQRLGGNYLKPDNAVAGDAETGLAAGKLSGDEQKDYSTAFSYVKKQDFAKAEQAFSAYIKRHKKSARLPNALYWLGEVSLAQGKLESASSLFEQVIEKYPKSTKVADAMYKLGRTYQRMGSTGKAASIWQQLVQIFPNAPAATLATNALK